MPKNAEVSQLRPIINFPATHNTHSQFRYCVGPETTQNKKFAELNRGEKFDSADKSNPRRARIVIKIFFLFIFRLLFTSCAAREAHHIKQEKLFSLSQNTMKIIFNIILNKLWFHHALRDNRSWKWWVLLLLFLSRSKRQKKNKNFFEAEI